MNPAVERELMRRNTLLIVRALRCEPADLTYVCSAKGCAQTKCRGPEFLSRGHPHTVVYKLSHQRGPSNDNSGMNRSSYIAAASVRAHQLRCLAVFSLYVELQRRRRAARSPRCPGLLPNHSPLVYSLWSTLRSTSSTSSAETRRRVAARRGVPVHRRSTLLSVAWDRSRRRCH